MATADYIISNQSGASFRTDLNNTLAAIVSNNSNSSSPATTYAYQWWADTSNGILKIRNSANNAWIELFQLDGTLTLEDGSASTPALAFRDDLNTGIFSSAADTFNVATGGAERLEISSSNTIFNEAGANIDFRIESDTKTHMFFLDAGDNRIGINESGPQCIFQITDTGSGGDGVIENLRLNSSQNNTNDGNKIQFTRVNGASGSISCVKVLDNNTTDMIFGTRVGNTESESMRLEGSGRLLLGTSTEISSSSERTLQVQNTGGPKIALARNDTSISSGNTIGGIEFYGNDLNQGFVNTASILVQADGTHGNDDKPTRMEFYTTADGGSSSSEHLRITASGHVKATSEAGTYQASSGNFHESFTNTNNQHIHWFQHSGNTQAQQYGIRVKTGDDGNDGNSLLQCSSGSATAGLILRNGSFQSRNNSFGGVSDIKLKENIVDAKSQWDDIKAIKFRNFNFIDNPSKKMLGVVAQEIELVSAGLVEDIVDRDPDTNEDLGTVTKHVKSSILYMKAMKCLQEAVAKIETLEAKVAALEAA